MNLWLIVDYLLPIAKKNARPSDLEGELCTLPWILAFILFPYQPHRTGLKVTFTA